jgi:hypothetical protein
MLARGSHNIILFNSFNKLSMELTLIEYPLYKIFSFRGTFTQVFFPYLTLFECYFKAAGTWRMFFHGDNTDIPEFADTLLYFLVTFRVFRNKFVYSAILWRRKCNNACLSKTLFGVFIEELDHAVRLSDVVCLLS